MLYIRCSLYVTRLPKIFLVYVFAWLLPSTLLPSKLFAQQITFHKEKTTDAYNFQYQWLDYKNAQRSLSFQLSNESLFDRFRNFRNYQQTYAQKTILRRIKKQMMKAPIEGVQLSYRQQQDNYFIEARGVDNQKVSEAYYKLEQVEQEVTQAYLKETYYQTFTNHNQETGIKVDHVSIANESVADLKPLKPLILDHVSIKNVRKATNFVLGFVQNIPYNKLESRITSSGAGFNTPLKLLFENQGDCDSKMTLTAALLRALMPRIEMVLVFTENHAFIGINVPAGPGELTITHNGITYLLGDPTGPAVLPLGVLGAESELAINQGHYTAQDYHEVLSVNPEL